MAVRTVAELLAELSTGGSAYNHIETALLRDTIDTLNAIATTDVAALLAGGTAIIVLPTADPEIVGALCNDTGTITVSAG